MFAQELGQNLAAAKTVLKASRAKYYPIFLLVLFLFTILAASLDQHVDLNTPADCVFFKFTEDLSGGNKTTPLVLSSPEFLAETTPFIFQRLRHFNGFVSSYCLRSPPLKPR